MKSHIQGRGRRERAEKGEDGEGGEGRGWRGGERVFLIFTGERKSQTSKCIHMVYIDYGIKLPVYAQWLFTVR